MFVPLDIACKAKENWVDWPAGGHFYKMDGHQQYDNEYILSPSSQSSSIA
jgi:hypothetical protein